MKDVVIVGSSFKEGMTVVTHNNTKGLVRAFDAKTGKLLWTFNTIPAPGEFGNETWQNSSWATNGNTGVWTQMTVDEDLGLVYLPVESPTSDFYGGERPGDNLYGESLVCVDLKTGKRKWHFQIVHHPIWDYDLSSAPILADINVDGKAIKAVALPSKESFLYVFDRVTGEPVWPIEERAVPQSDVPGEKTSPTQPFPTKPPGLWAQLHQGAGRSDRFHARDARPGARHIARYKTGPMFLPPVVGDPQGLAGRDAIWATPAAAPTGLARDTIPKRTSSMRRPINPPLSPISLRIPPPGFTDIRYVMGRNDTDFRVSEGPGFGSAADAPQPVRRRRPRRLQPAAARRDSAPSALYGARVYRWSSRPTPSSRPSISIAATCNGRCPTAKRPMWFAIIPALKGMNIPQYRPARQRWFARH